VAASPNLSREVDVRLPYPIQLLVLTLVGWLQRQQADVIEYLRVENQVLREQLRGRRLRFSTAQRLRLARAGKAVGRRALRGVATLVTPDTLLRWFRDLVARKYDGGARRAAPTTPARARVLLADLVEKIALENPGFGYTRIRDALRNVGREVARTTVKRILAGRGIEPAPERRKRTSWATFLAAHWDGLFAADFFTAEVLTWSGLVRYHVLVVMELRTRRVHVAGIRRDPDAAWALQVARNLTDPVDGFLRACKLLILDRDPLYTSKFRELLGGAGTKVLRLPARSPNLNAYVERWILGAKSECLDKLILLGEGHLRRAVAEYVAHFHGERNHQGLESAIIDPEPGLGEHVAESEIVCRSRLGGLLRYYHRRAAS
jgi:hypothetical protein